MYRYSQCMWGMLDLLHRFISSAGQTIDRKLSETHPSFSTTGSSIVGSSSVIVAPTVEITSRKCFIAWTCFSVPNFRYSCSVYCSLQGCCADRELTRLPNDCIVLEISVRVRVVCSSWGWNTSWRIRLVTISMLC